MTANPSRKAARTKKTAEAPAAPQAKAPAPTHAVLEEATYAALGQMLSERPFHAVAPLFARLGEQLGKASIPGKTREGKETVVEMLAIPVALWNDINRVLSQSDAAPTFAVVRNAIHLVPLDPPAKG